MIKPATVMMRTMISMKVTEISGRKASASFSGSKRYLRITARSIRTTNAATRFRNRNFARISSMIEGLGDFPCLDIDKTLPDAIDKVNKMNLGKNI